MGRSADGAAEPGVDRLGRVGNRYEDVGLPIQPLPRFAWVGGLRRVRLSGIGAGLAAGSEAG